MVISRSGNYRTDTEGSRVIHYLPYFGAFAFLVAILAGPDLYTSARDRLRRLIG